MRFIQRLILSGLMTVAGLMFAEHPALAQNTISTFAGGAVVDGGAATTGILRNPSGLVVQSDGTMYIADEANHRVRKVDTSGLISTVAGTGGAGFSGDGGPATLADLFLPRGLYVKGNDLFIADSGNERIRKVNFVTGAITTIAGSGSSSYSGDDGQATLAGMHNPTSVAVDANNNLYIGVNNVIRKVDSSGIITLFAGQTNVFQSTGDGGAATQAGISFVKSLTVDTNGNLYLVDQNVVRKIIADGTISRFAGTGDFVVDVQGDGGAATLADLPGINGLVATATALYISTNHTDGHQVRKVNFSDNIISTVAGSGPSGTSTDGGAATQAALNTPFGLGLDSSDNLYFTEQALHRVRKVLGVTGAISTAAGAGKTFSGAGVNALLASLASPKGIGRDNPGNIYFCDQDHSLVRKIDTNGVITTFAGTGEKATSLVGDGGQATAAALGSPQGLAVDGQGNVYILDNTIGVVRKVSPNGIITTVAGDGTLGVTGEGVQATQTSVRSPSHVAVDKNGNLYIVMPNLNQIKKVTASTGILTNFAGTGASGFSGDGGKATQAIMTFPQGIAVNAAGDVFISDAGQASVRIRRVDIDGNINTVAGNGAFQFAGDNGPATQAAIGSSRGIVFDAAGNMYFADGFNRIRKVTAGTGTITTVVGGADAFGDGQAATGARLFNPQALAIANNGDLLITDSSNHRIRRVAGLTAGPIVFPGFTTQADSIKVKLTLSGTVQILIFKKSVTIPIDSGFIDIGKLNDLGEVDLDDSAIDNIVGVAGAADALQPLVDKFQDFTLHFPKEAFADRNLKLNIDFRNFVVDALDPSAARIAPVVVDGDTIPIFFYLRMTMEKDGRIFDRFDFKPGFPMTVAIPLAGLDDLLNLSGFSDVNTADLLLAFLTPRGLDQEGIFTYIDHDKSALVLRTSHLSDIIGLRKSDVPVPPPAAIVSGPAVFADTTFAKVAWQTNRVSTSQVRFGTVKTALNDSTSTAADSSGVLNHLVQIGNLTKSTKYFYQVWSVDQLGRRVASSVDSFRTRGVVDVAPPVFSLRPVVRDIAPDNALIVWGTDRRSTSSVVYDTTKSLSFEVSDATEVTNHQVALTGLTSGKKYFFLVTSTAGSQSVKSDTLIFQTPAIIDTSKLVIVRPSRVDGFAVTDTTALVRWATNLPSNSEVVYWKKGTTDTTVAFDAQSVREHTVVLSGLKAATDYLYFARSTRSSSGKIATGALDFFKTKGSNQITPLRFVERPSVAYRTNNQVIVAWKTNLPTDGFVYYQQVASGNTFNADLAQVRGDIGLNQKHKVTVGGLVANARYLFVITSKAPNGQFLVHPPGTQINAKPIADGPMDAVIITGIVQVPGGEGNFTTSSGPDTQAPVILNGPTIVSQTSTSLIIQWATDELSTSVVNFGAGSNLDQTFTDEQQVTTHQVTLSNLSPSTSYSFQVASTDPSNNGPTQSTTGVSSTTQSADTTPPVVNDGSITAFPSDVQAIVQWDTDEGSNSEVQYGTHQDSLITSLVDDDVVTAHNVTLTGLSASAKYYYRVFSSDATGNKSIQGSTKNFTTSATADTVHPVIANVSASAVAQSNSTVTITFTWTTDRLASSFADYDTLNTLATKEVAGSQAGSTEHSVTVAGLKLNTTYHYQVGSANVNDTRVPAPTTTSSIQTIATPTSVDAAGPSAPTVTAIPGDGAVLLRWTPSTDVSGIKGYDIRRGGTLLISNVTDTTFVDQTVTNGTGYSYTVAAIDNANNAGSASLASGTVTPAATQVATAPTASATADTVSLKPTLVVGNATPVSGDATRATLTYSFQVATDSLFTSIVISVTGIGQGTSTNPTHWQAIDTGRPDSTALTAGTRYFWRSRAHDGVFNGQWSSVKKFVASSAKPTSVALSSMSADSDRGVVTVEWTVSRVDALHAGFRVYRSQRRNGPFDLLTNRLITSDTNDFRYFDGAVRVGQEYFYLIEAVDVNGNTERYGPVSLRVDAPRTFSLQQNTPNPFNPETTIRFELPSPQRVTLIVYNVLGQEVIRLLDNTAFEAGYHKVVWNGRNASGQATSSGLYLYRIVAGEFVTARKMVLLK